MSDPFHLLPPAPPPTGVRKWLGEPRTGPARWVIALAIFAAVMGSSLGLNGVVLGWSWVPQSVITVIATLLPMAIVRRYAPTGAFAPLVGLLGWATALIVMFFGPTTRLGFIPTGRTLTALNELVQQLSQTIMIMSAPVPMDVSLVFIICAGLGLAALLMDALAVALGIPAASGIGLVLILFVPAIVKPTSVGLTGFIGAAAGYLLILGCCSWYAPGGRLRRAALGAPSGQFRRAAGLAAVVVLLMALVPLAIPGFRSGAFPQGSLLGSVGDVSGLDPMISLGNNLRAPDGGIQMTYSTSSAAPIYVRLTTLEDFSGKNWQPTNRNALLRNGTGDISNNFGPAPDVPVTDVYTKINTTNLTGTWLPAPYAPLRITGLDGNWKWDPLTLSVSSNLTTTLDQRYTVESVVPNLTPAILNDATAAPSDLNPIFTQLPGNVPGIIKSTAEDITKDQGSAFDKAVALQNYLRSSLFTYSEKTPVQDGYDGSGMDVIAKFLEVKSGYCVHFSAAMAVMARELGIPSRIDVGYAPGQPTGVTTRVNGRDMTGYEVDGHDAHAWPELYFQGVGWVPFEPTPSRGAVPSYTQNNAAVTTPGQAGNDLPHGGSANQTPGATATATPTPKPAAKAPVAVAKTPAPARIGATAGAVLLVLLALASPWFTRKLVRRRRLALIRAGDSADGRDSPEVLAWRELTATAADYGYKPDPTDTPRAQADQIITRLGADNINAVDAVTEVARAYERAIYGPARGSRGGPGTGGTTMLLDAGTQLATDLGTVEAGLKSRATATARARALVLPPSLFKQN